MRKLFFLLSFLFFAASASAQTVLRFGVNSIILAGTGSPEGVIYGRVGDQYHCTASCSSHYIYVKETGSFTNTGWVAHDAPAVAAGTQTANTIFAGPTGGGAATPTFRALVGADFGTTLTPQFARVGFGAAADSTAVGKFSGQYWSVLFGDGNSGTSKTIDWDSGNEHFLTLTGNVVLTFSNPKDGGRYVLLFDTGAGSFSVTFPGTVLWPAATTPTITTTAGKVDLCTFIYVTSTSKYYGSCNQNY